MSLKSLSRCSSEQTLVASTRPYCNPSQISLPDSEDAASVSMGWVADWAQEMERQHKAKKTPFKALECPKSVEKFRINFCDALARGLRLEHALAMPVTSDGKNIAEVIVHTESFLHLGVLRKIAQWDTIEYSNFKLTENFLQVRHGDVWRGLSTPGSSLFSGEMVDGVLHGWGKHHRTACVFYEGNFSEGLYHGQGKMYTSAGVGSRMAKCTEGFWCRGDAQDVKSFYIERPSQLRIFWDNFLTIFDVKSYFGGIVKDKEE